MCWCMCIQPCTQAYLVLKQFHRIPLADLEMVLPGEGMKPSYRGGLAHFAVHCPRSALHATCIECPLATLLKCVCLHARAVVQQSMLAHPARSPTYAGVRVHLPPNLYISLAFTLLAGLVAALAAVWQVGSPACLAGAPALM